MYFYIVFENSNDFIKFKSIHHDLVLEYIDFINSNCANKFKIQNKKNISSCISNLKNSIVNFNKTIISDLFPNFPVPELDEDFLNQDYLNKIHAHWVNSQHKLYSIDDLKQSEHFYKLDYLFQHINDDIIVLPLSTIIHKFNLEDEHSLINQNVHNLESKFKLFKFKGDFNGWISRPNLYKNYTSDSIANFKIAFNHCGRTLRNKFINYDVNLEHRDENTYDQLLGFVELSLNPPETIQYSTEYLSWCSKNNVLPSGDYLNLGNIVDLEKNLFNCRKILYKNLANDNYFTLTTKEV